LSTPVGPRLAGGAQVPDAGKDDTDARSEQRQYLTACVVSCSICPPAALRRELLYKTMVVKMLKVDLAILAVNMYASVTSGSQPAVSKKCSLMPQQRRPMMDTNQRCNVWHQ